MSKKIKPLKTPYKNPFEEVASKRLEELKNSNGELKIEPVKQDGDNWKGISSFSSMYKFNFNDVYNGPQITTSSINWAIDGSEYVGEIDPYKEQTPKKEIEKKPVGAAIKIFIVGNHAHSNWMENIRIVDEMEQADVVFFTGGQFLNPELWRGSMVTQHGFGFTPDNERDIADVKAFIKAKSLKKKIIGCGRGAHLCCILSGGKVIQYVHSGTIYDVTVSPSGNRVSSLHFTNENRMQQWPTTEVRWLQIAKQLTNGNNHIIANDNDLAHLNNGDVKIAYYDDSDALAIETFVWHPSCPKDFVNLCNDLLLSLNNGTLRKEYSVEDFRDDNWMTEEQDVQWDEHQRFNDDDEPIDEDGNLMDWTDAEALQKERTAIRHKMEYDTFRVNSPLPTLSEKIAAMHKEVKIKKEKEKW